MTPGNAASEIVQPAELTPENAALAFEGTDVLASWVDRVGRRARKPECAGLRFAFYGRVSTEDCRTQVRHRHGGRLLAQ